MTHLITVKIAPIVSLEHQPQPGRVLFRRNALKLLPGRTDVPLVIDHSMGAELGRIDKLFTLDWIDGPWVAASGWLDKAPPSWLRRGSPASFARWDAHAASDELGERVVSAWLKEVSICLSSEPLEAGAQVLSIRRTETKPEALEEIVQTTGVIYRPSSGVVLGIR